jgi:hypothetical protein
MEFKVLNYLEARARLAAHGVVRRYYLDAYCFYYYRVYPIVRSPQPARVIETVR